MGKRIVEITQTALADMEEIYDYIADVLLAVEKCYGSISPYCRCNSHFGSNLRDVRFLRQSRNNLGECAEW